MKVFEPKPNVKFYDANTRREMMYVYPISTSWVKGWILVKHVDGTWVTLRKANGNDIEAINKAVIECHHEEQSDV